MHKHLVKNNEACFEKIFYQRLGFLLFKEYCEQLHFEPIPQLKFYEQIKQYEAIETTEERRTAAKEIYDNFIMRELLGHTHCYSKKAISSVQRCLMRNEVPTDLFGPYIEEIIEQLKTQIFDYFIESEKYTRYCQCNLLSEFVTVLKILIQFLFKFKGKTSN